jgi:hypothetical protein
MSTKNIPTHLHNFVTTSVKKYHADLKNGLEIGTDNLKEPGRSRSEISVILLDKIMG